MSDGRKGRARGDGEGKSDSDGQSEYIKYIFIIWYMNNIGGGEGVG